MKISLSDLKKIIKEEIEGSNATDASMKKKIASVSEDLVDELHSLEKRFDWSFDFIKGKRVKTPSGEGEVISYSFDIVDGIGKLILRIELDIDSPKDPPLVIPVHKVTFIDE